MTKTMKLGLEFRGSLCLWLRIFDLDNALTCSILSSYLSMLFLSVNRSLLVFLSCYMLSGCFGYILLDGCVQKELGSFAKDFLFPCL